MASTPIASASLGGGTCLEMYHSLHVQAQPVMADVAAIILRGCNYRLSSPPSSTGRTGGPPFPSLRWPNWPTRCQPQHMSKGGGTSKVSEQQHSKGAATAKPISHIHITTFLAAASRRSCCKREVPPQLIGTKGNYTVLLNTVLSHVY
jgi:hypothetical protein